MILYIRTQRSAGQRMAIAGAAVSAVLAVVWLASGTPGPAGTANEAAVPAPSPSTAPVGGTPPPQALVVAAPAPAPAASAPPLQFIGHWREGHRQAVLLGYQGRNVTVLVPGRVDDRYEVVSANDHEVVLRDLAAGSMQHPPLGTAPSAAATAVAPQPALAATTQAPGAQAAPRKLPPPSRRTSDEYEPEN